MNEAEKFLSESDAVMAKIINSYALSKLVSSGNVFHDLMSCVLEQQIHYRSTKKLFLKMLEKSGLEELHPGNFLLFEEKVLQTSGISSAKRDTALRLFEYSDKVSSASLSESQIREKLTAIKGIGKKTVDMILIYTLQSPDAFAEDDYHIKKIMAEHYGLNTPARIRKKAEEWSPYRSTAFRYLLASAGKV